MGPWPWPSLSMVSVKAWLPSGTSARSLARTSRSVSAISRSKASSVRARPKRPNSSPRRRSPSRMAAMEARVSPFTISGKRELR